NMKGRCVCAPTIPSRTTRWERLWWRRDVPGKGVGYLQAALKARVDYFEAHSNLGLALAAQNDFEGASQHFDLALKLQPDDANVEANLGAAMAELGHFPEAKAHFERALQIDPNQAIAKENLEAVKNRDGCALSERVKIPTPVAQDKGGAPSPNRLVL
ncbi:MAG TPA: tetratricopeptide repeat protein, partial [Candidatus Sulfotelmatobacter sp.]